MYYNLAIILLFGPLINLQFTNSEIRPYNICVQAADAINSLNSAYTQLYGMQRTPCFMPIITLAASVMHVVQANVENKLKILPHSKLEGILALQGMSYSHKFARHAIKYINVLKKRSGQLVQTNLLQKNCWYQSEARFCSESDLYMTSQNGQSNITSDTIRQTALFIL